MNTVLRILKWLGKGLLLLILLYAVGRPMQIWLDGYYAGERAPYLQMPSATAITLRWHSLHNYAGEVRFGSSPERLTQQQQESLPGKAHEIRLSGLQPGRRYYYQIREGDKVVYGGRDFYFDMPPQQAAQSVRLWITGDQGNANKVQAAVRDAMLHWVRQHPQAGDADPAPDVWITTGDNAYRSGSNAQFQTGFFQPYKKILRHTPVWPAYGNHDARRWAFFDLFTFPTQGESGGLASGTEHYYSFDHGNLHVVMLDSQASARDTDGEMAQWLQKDLQTTQQPWVLVFFHHPPYSKGSHDSDNRWDSRGRMIDMRENILPILERYGVDVVFSGHSHMYERSELMNCHYGSSDTFASRHVRQRADRQQRYYKQAAGRGSYDGTIYTVIGSSSGANDGPLNHPALPYSFKQAGSVIVDVSGNQLTATFINMAANAVDRFTLVKGAKNGTASKPCQ